MARRLLLRPGVGEQLLMSKLQILAGIGSRRPSLALNILTGNVEDSDSSASSTLTLVKHHHHAGRQYAARTVYLSEAHLRDIERIIAAWQQIEPRRVTRSAVLRRAVEHLHAAVEANPAKSLRENE